MTTADQDSASVIKIDSSELDQLRSDVLKAQISTYRYLARNLPVSDSLLNSCSYKFQLVKLIQNHLPQEQSNPTGIVVTHSSALNDLNTPLTFSTATDMYRSLTGSNEKKHENIPIHRIEKHPINLNPLYTQQERDKRVLNRMSIRVQELEYMPANMNAELRTRSLIELKSLKLLQLQKQLRGEVLNTIKKDTYIQTALNPRAYKRPKRHQLREARATEYNERRRKLEIKQQKQAKHQEFLNAILTHSRDFHEYHRRYSMATVRMSKSVQAYFANNERELIKRKKGEDKRRLLTLMKDDEEAYRKLVDEKKDARLALLLSQTDAYIDTLKQLVRQHQQVNRSLAKSDKTIDYKSKESAQTLVNRSSATTSISDQTSTERKSNSTTATEDDEYDAKESYYSIAHRIREPITEQSKMLVGGQLKQYQLQGLEWLVSLHNNNLNGILADEMGLGKTIQTIALIVHLIDSKNNPGPSLIIVPLSTLSNWAAEFLRWAPDVVVIQYKGLPNVRKTLGQTIRTNRFNVLLTTYEYIMRDRSILSKVPWKYLIVDEGHRMKNHHCKLTQILNTYYANAPHRLLLTGTPLQNNLPELWALLNFILPTIFKSSTTFTDWFNAPFATLPSEKVELNHEETLLIIKRLHKVLRPFLLRRLKKEVESQLPEKVEYIVKCELSALQRCLYHAMAKNRTLIIENQNGKGGRRALMNKIMQLRKICNHPFLFHEIEERLAQSFGCETGAINGPDLFRVSGKFELLDRILPKLKASGHKILLFCQMTSVMDILEYYFSYRNYSYIRLDGTTKADDRCELLKDFNDDNINYFIFLLSTRAGGVGLNLQRADTVILFDSDWNPHQDQQAQDRAHRIGQKNEVRVLRLMTVNTVEEKILACARYKLNVDEKVIQAGKFNRSSTSSERQNYLEQLIEGDDELKDDDEDIPDDEILNQMIARTEQEFNLFNRMDVARREYESLHGVGSGGDGANERRAWELLEKNENTKSVSRNKRKKESDNEDSTDQTNKTSKTPISPLDASDDEATREGTLTTGDETTPSLLEELEDEEDVDFTQEKPLVHRKMKINRLMTDDELPDWLKRDVDQVEKTLENDEDFGKGRRQRKDVDYSDNLTEREFLQALEEGNLDETVEQRRLQKQSRKHISSLQDNNSIDLDESETRSSFDIPSTSNQPYTTPKRGSMKKRLETVDPKTAGQCHVLIDHLLAYRTDDDRQLAQVFIRLPGQKQLPLYYQIIQEPIDFQRIKRKIDTYRYSNLEQLDADMKLLVENAQTFNCETSTIYSDSILLEKVYLDLREQLKSGLLEMPTETTTVSDESTTTSQVSSSKRGRSARITAPVATTVNTDNRTFSRRGRKRKATILKEDDLSEDEQVISDSGDNEEN
ncbi:unnamed protein product [Rotaria socialis]|uniref:Uncharacterized protein n=1 Tax=Rotaria socialis TaxID=392032 RepID=A0A820NWT4_9BILA|nr:unnamed protein product [Rotaria socialis]CAF3502214.1 unnamed protein product [Rotaria socialis]CAF4395207.1 unnamed protein product [Rotaria socialis]CAF4572534.1 unnamed protein product [Rotaria socialis]